jgi:hypothetical protein
MMMMSSSSSSSSNGVAVLVARLDGLAWSHIGLSIFVNLSGPTLVP